MNPYRFVVLGAGFSRPAGLPLGNELLRHILDDVKSDSAQFDCLMQDIQRYVKYHEKRFGQHLSIDEIDLEQFVSFLDLEHYFWLQGSDTLTDEGNRTQLIIRSSISRVLSRMQQRMTNDQWSLYEKFVSRLSPDDIVVTFNYDTIVETACERAKVPYRLCPDRYKAVYSRGGGEIRSDPGEVVIFKMHGSIDWFRDDFYREIKRTHSEAGLEDRVIMPMFDRPDMFGLKALFDEPYPEDDALRGIWRVTRLAEFWTNRDLDEFPAPYILSPSSAKMLYADRVRLFWHSFNGMGRCCSQALVIGFSFPSHDEYAIQPIVTALWNFQEKNDAWHYFRKTRLKVVDLQSHEAVAGFRQSRPFINWEQSLQYWNGLNEAIVDEILEPPEELVD